MKKLNKKLNNQGFTLIELLAVIVILAIVMVITIPTVLNSTNSAKKNAFETSAQTIADWFEKQYGLAQVNDANLTGGSLDTNFTNLCNNDGLGCTGTTAKTIDAATMKAAGGDMANYDSATVLIGSNGRACVTLTAKSTGKFGTQANPAKSQACS